MILSARLRLALKHILVTLLALAILGLGARIWVSQRGPALAPWHTWVPHELSSKALDSADWQVYLHEENRLFDEMSKNVSEQLTSEQKNAINRYWSGSQVWPGKSARDWNRSWELWPDTTPRGVVVLLHGLTDSPYSMSHIGQHYRDKGYVAIGIRLPGHGTVPGSLTNVEWQQWLAATRLAMREAARIAQGRLPVDIVGYSNGGALALKYTLDTLEDDRLLLPRRVVLISPMIGVTRYARFAGLAGLPALLPPFAKAAWLSIQPEFNPFKYNSFPVNGARQSWLLTQALREQLNRLVPTGGLIRMPSVLTFQSVLDDTVSARAVVDDFYRHLPTNGSQLALFDVNRARALAPLLGASALGALDNLLPPAPRAYATFVVSDTPDSDAARVTITPSGETQSQVASLGRDYPAWLFSLSHVALPFPDNDALYGSHPVAQPAWGVPLGSMRLRGERSGLLVDAGSLQRATSNPFYEWMLQQIDAGLSPASDAVRLP